MKLKRSEMACTSSINTPGWKFVRLSGEHAGPFTVLCRCASAVTYAPWISDRLVEYYVLKGTLMVNDVELSEGDYGSVEPRMDGHLSDKASMEALCVVHGKIIWAKEVFDSLRKRSLSSQETRALLSLPWIEHLRRHVGEEDIGWLCDLIDEQSDETIIELCISTARKLKSGRLIDTVNKTLQPQIDLSLRVTATLYLASKDEADASLWETQLHEMAKKPDELLRVVRVFYSATSNEELVEVIKHRINTEDYNYNMPFYKMITRMAAR